jgi:transcription antitermination factor NusG
MAIKSAVVQDHLKSYVYIEAEREDNVKRALQGMRQGVPLVHSTAEPEPLLVSEATASVHFAA